MSDPMAKLFDLWAAHLSSRRGSALDFLSRDDVQKLYGSLSAEESSAVRAWLSIQAARDEIQANLLQSQHAPFKEYDLRPLMRNAERYQARVCKVSTPLEAGTGFLVGPDVVLTNYHVVA